MALVIGDLTEIWTISADIQCSCAFIWGEPDESRTIYPITPTLPNPCLCFGCTTGTMQMNPHRVLTALVLLFLNFTVPAVLSLLAFKSDGGGPLLQTIFRWTDRPIPSSIRPIAVTSSEDRPGRAKEIPRHAFPSVGILCHVCLCMMRGAVCQWAHQPKAGLQVSCQSWSASRCKYTLSLRAISFRARRPLLARCRVSLPG